jgi:hypothetical protein
MLTIFLTYKQPLASTKCGIVSPNTGSLVVRLLLSGPSVVFPNSVQHMKPQEFSPRQSCQIRQMVFLYVSGACFAAVSANVIIQCYHFLSPLSGQGLFEAVPTLFPHIPHQWLSKCRTDYQIETFLHVWWECTCLQHTQLFTIAKSGWGISS